MPTLTIDLDLAFEDDMDADLALESLLAEIPGVAGTILTLDGPSGWPLVRFEIPSDSLAAFADAYGVDLEDLEEGAL